MVTSDLLMMLLIAECRGNRPALEFCNVTKKDPFCEVIRFAIFEPMLVKNVLSP